MVVNGNERDDELTPPQPGEVVKARMIDVGGGAVQRYDVEVLGAFKGSLLGRVLGPSGKGRVVELGFRHVSNSIVWMFYPSQDKD